MSAELSDEITLLENRLKFLKHQKTKMKDANLDAAIAYGYCRVSTDRQAEEGLSIEEQQDRCFAFYEANLKPKGIRWGDCFRDPGTSGKVPFIDREAGRQLFDRLKKGDHVIMCRLDRGFRNFRDCVDVTEGWLTRGINIHLLDMGMSTDTMVGRFVHRIFAALAEMMREIIVENVTRGVRKKIELYGTHTGVMPFGWRNGGSGKRPKKVPFEEERRQMALITHLIEDHRLTFNEVYNLFWHYGMGVAPKGSYWSPARIQNAHTAYRKERFATPCCQLPPPADWVPYTHKPRKGRKHKQGPRSWQSCPPRVPADSSLRIIVTDSTVPFRVLRLHAVRPANSTPHPSLARQQLSKPFVPALLPPESPRPSSGDRATEAREAAAEFASLDLMGE